ncbi:hypothetical protein [Vibrio hepatarius]|uniref:hypothetical protein n=1 Tax=Vibrio hepatarius TaxID=171383 RepID=UPI001C085BBD|nr:hypothetical protein [Vibrio hepatarius]MBU2899002.1 hypothetical protein [Vibrio hepatarius]
MKKIGLVLYGAAYLLLSLFNIITSILAGAVSVGFLVSITFTTLYLLGFYGYLFKKPIFTPKVWRILFYLQCFALVLQLMPILFEFSIELLVINGIMLIITLPILVCLYRYSSPDSEIWISATDRVKVSQIERLLATTEVISASKTTGEKTTTVTMSKVADNYIVHIKRTSTEVESFKNEFVTLNRAVEFVEKYTSISSEELVTLHI